EEAPCLLDPHEPSAHRLEEAFLYCFDLLSLDLGEQCEFKAAPDDGCDPQVINHGWSQPREPLMQCPNNAGRQRQLERCDGNPLLVFLDEGTALDPALEEFLGKERIPLAVCMQESIHCRAERIAKSAPGKCSNLCNREGTDDDCREGTLTGELAEGAGQRGVTVDLALAVGAQHEQVGVRPEARKVAEQ